MEKTMLRINNKSVVDKAIPFIMTVVRKAGYNIDVECIKPWGCSTMAYDDVIRGISNVRERGRNAVIYTNNVLLKEKISEREGITVLDNASLKQLAEEQGDFELYYLLSSPC